VRKVTIMVRFNRGGKFVMKRAQHAANGKLVPRRAVGMRSDIEGACRYYLRYRLPDGRRVYDPVGESSIEALAAANRKEIELFAALRSAEVAEPDAPQVAPSRVKVDNAIGQYLSNFASPDQRTTFLAYRRALDIFREACTCEYVDQITVDCVRSFVARLRGEFDQDTVYHRYHYVEFFLGKHGKNNLLLKSERPKKRPVDVAALSRHVRKLPASLRRSLTWDRGLEMAKHKSFTVATHVKVYFCEPQSPWQRGTNENTNGLLRQYFLKRTDLSGYSQAELDKVALHLNQRPRKTLGFETPASRLRASVASTH